MPVFLLLFICFFPFVGHAQDQTYKQQLMRLGRTITAAEKQSEAINAELQKLRDEEEEQFETIMGYRLETAKVYHALKVSERSSRNSIFLLPDRQYQTHIYELRKKETLRDILMSRMSRQTQALLELQERQSSIKNYLERRQILAITVDSSLNQLNTINESRQSPENIQRIIAKLKEENESLDAFMYSLLKMPPPQINNTEPLRFSLPVSGVITQDSTGIYIKAAPRSLITSPERGVISFAGEFEPLGKIIIINHGEGYISILKNLDTIFVKEGITLQKDEPIGTLSDKSRDNSVNSTMLYFELRYNNSIINPIDKITGL